ncbi:hypothetical protein AW736_26295 [Termitidicoccus mucosus]|uniref:Uncharacterized protein n=1 Tax=Termitidicoccus mucosus TaxID=1184151 RepID=A0A178IPU4_9BACT|nr:hypothetical protein AW736_26295 [Opitutaceae bacterium TSB47]
MVKTLDADFEANRQVWRETTESVYHEMLNILPPAYLEADMFMLGEPYSHNANGEAVFSIFMAREGHYFALHGTRRQVRDGKLPPLPA